LILPRRAEDSGMLSTIIMTPHIQKQRWNAQVNGKR
jgi:hypothetical protein